MSFFCLSLVTTPRAASMRSPSSFCSKAICVLRFKPSNMHPLLLLSRRSDAPADSHAITCGMACIASSPRLRVRGPYAACVRSTLELNRKPLTLHILWMRRRGGRVRREGAGTAKMARVCGCDSSACSARQVDASTPALAMN